MDASCFIQDSIHGLSYFIVSRILGTYQTHKIRTATISKINNKSEHILSNESVRIMRYWLPSAEGAQSAEELSDTAESGISTLLPSLSLKMTVSLSS